MNRAARSLVLAAVAGFGHVIYPLYLWRRTSTAAPPEPPRPRVWPPISVVIPAYLEAGVIRAKVSDVLDNDYPGEVEVIVVADDDATAAAARETPARVDVSEARGGKARALNRGFAAAAHDVVVFTDANTSLSTDALRNLVRWLDDPSICAVAGEKRVAGSEQESIYWRFESWLKQREFTTGTTIGLVGELGAVRKECFTPLPGDITNDDLWMAVTLVQDGRRIAYEPAAAATEEAQSMDEEWERRTRIVAGALDVLARKRSALAPGATDATFQIWGHRLIRMTAGPVAHLALLRAALRSLHRSRTARLFVLAHGAAGWALVRQRRGEAPSSVERAGAHALWLQGVALGGMWRFVRREDTVLWPKPERVPAPTGAVAER